MWGIGGVLQPMGKYTLLTMMPMMPMMRVAILQQVNPLSHAEHVYKYLLLSLLKYTLSFSLF